LNNRKEIREMGENQELSFREKWLADNDGEVLFIVLIGMLIFVKQGIF